MAYIDPQIQADLVALGNNTAILDTLSFKTRNVLRKARQTVGPAYGAQPGFDKLPGWEQTNIINEATLLATS
jgi:hypothetical protein